MENEDKIPTPLQAALIIIISYFLSFVLVVLFVELTQEEPASLESSFLSEIIMIGSELGLLILPYLYLKRRNYPVRQLFRWKGIDKNLIWVIILIGLSLSILGDELDRLINIFFTPPEILKELEGIFKIHNASDFILLFTGMVVVAAFVEETVFRGLLQVSFETHQNVTRAVIYTSLAWTIIHGILFWAVQIFLIGIILGYLAWRTKSIIPSVICHGINNGLALLFNNVDGSGFYSIYEWKGHVSPIILIPAILILVKGIKLLDSYYLRMNSSVGDSASSDSSFE